MPCHPYQPLPHHRPVSLSELQPSPSVNDDIELSTLAASHQDHHICRSRKSVNTAWRRFEPWYILPVHAICTVLFIAAMLGFVNGRPFQAGEHTFIDKLKHPTIEQTDVTTMVSAMFTRLRWLTGNWIILVAWRSIFVLLEKSSLSLRDIDRMASRKCLPNP